MKSGYDGVYVCSVKIGPKGQIVIPKEVRDMFNLSPGDSLVMLADLNKGIALETNSVFKQVTDAIFAGKTIEEDDE